MNLDDMKRNQHRMWVQLRSGSGTEGSDCGVIGDLNIITECSSGKVGPDLDDNGELLPPRDPQSVASWVKYIRRIAGNPTGPMMVYGDVYQALDSSQIKAAFRNAGLRPMTVEYKYGVEFWRIRQWLDDGPHRSVLLAINYSVARLDGCPTGSDSFGGGHIVMFHGAERRRIKIGRTYRKVWKTLVGDSLNDGRARPGGTRYPRGWQIARIHDYQRAAGAFGTAPDGTPRPIGKGRAVAIFIERN